MSDDELKKIAEEIGRKAYDYWDVVPEFLEFILKKLRAVQGECQKEISEELKTLRRQSDTLLEEIRLFCFHLKDPPSLTGVAIRIQNIEFEQREAYYKDKLNRAHEEIERLLKRCTELADESRERMEANVECQNLSLPSEEEAQKAESDFVWLNRHEERFPLPHTALSWGFKHGVLWLRSNAKPAEKLELPSEEEFRDWSNSRKRMPFDLKLSDQRSLARAARLEAYNWLRANFKKPFYVDEEDKPIPQEFFDKTIIGVKKQAPVSDEEVWKYLTAVEPVLGPAYKAAAYLAWRAAEKHHGISE